MSRGSRRAVTRGKHILVTLSVASGLWLIWQWWNRPDQVRNAVASACEAIEFEGDRFTLCRFDPSQHAISLALTDKDGKVLRSFSALAKDHGAAAGKIVFAMNGGMYGVSGQPVGLYVEDGVERQRLNRNSGPGNFHMQPNGVFWSDTSGLHVATTELYASRFPNPGQRPDFATQSGPMLVIEGKLNPQFSADGPSRYRRNGMGVTQNGATLFAISHGKISFGKFARFFRDRLACPNALYLDGLISSLWDAASGSIDQRFPLGPMVVVTQVK